MEINFNLQLKAFRKQAGITQEQLADMVGVSPQAVSKWESSSYPDPALLPSIADALGVTIDSLFHRGEKQTVFQHIIHHLHQIECRKERLSEAYDICRCLVTALMGSEEFYPLSQAVLNAEDWEQYSQLALEDGIIQQRLPENLQYFFLMLKPEQGYDRVLQYEERYAELFRFLGSTDALRAIYFLMGRENTMFFHETALIAELGISQQRAAEILTDMHKLGLVRAAELNHGGTNETIYQYHGDVNFLMLMTFARTLLNHPSNFSYSCTEDVQPFFRNDTYKQA